MKKTTKILLITLVILSAFSCKKYDFDSGIQFKTVKNRLADKVWEYSLINSAYVQDSLESSIPKTIWFTNTGVIFKDDNPQKFRNVIINKKYSDINWSLNKDKQIDLFIVEDGAKFKSNISDIEILSLTDKQLRVIITQTVPKISAEPISYTIIYRTND